MSIASLKDEIERKRKNVESMNVLTAEKRCFRRGDLEAKQEEEYWKKYYLKSGNNPNKASSVDDAHEKAAIPNEKLQLPPRSDVIKKLRERNQPIRLFGESDIDSHRRLRLLETSEPELRGQRNDFKAAMDKIDRDYLSVILHADNPSSMQGNLDGKDDDDDDGEVGPPIPNQTEEVKEDTGYDLPDIIEQIKTTRKGNRAYDCQVVLNYFKFILKKWSQELNTRDIDEKKSVQGKIETALHTQTCAYMKPLFRKLKTNTLQDDILESLINVVNCVLKRNYIRANEFFLEMAIGNAPWYVFSLFEYI
ncbi:unnamed protein product [Rotaria magnacalcarata]|uniref:Pre-mRNA-splicing factor 18 n=1 Tax=Rotaria magnacalcarata TaxID=392030 RepID=A0A8S3C3M9_9BILA|nr:unnamed protein product [Rotaria magnacalcarata]